MTASRERAAVKATGSMASWFRRGFSISSGLSGRSEETCGFRSSRSLKSGKFSAIVDLGCGNGALVKKLHDRGLSVIGIDASEDLLRIARADYPDIPFICADAADFRLEQPVDAVFSNAVFHWIDRERQPAMLSCVYKALRKGGQFVFEFGGSGNNALIHEALRSEFEKRGCRYTMPFYFPGIGEYAPLVERAGFQVRTALLFDRPTELKGKDGLRDWIEMFVKVPFAGVKEDDRIAIIDGAVRRLEPVLYRNGKWHADYVRLRMKAVRR